MKKLLLFIILLAPLTLYFLDQGEDIAKEDDSDYTKDTLLSHTLKDNIQSHRKDVIAKAIGKKLVKNQSFKKLIQNDTKKTLTKKDVINDPAFVRKTFKKLYDCHATGCGEKPDHDGYFNAGQTAAIHSINQILELSLLDEANQDMMWPSEKELINLLTVENVKTRSLSLTHLLKRSDDPRIKELLFNEVTKLDGYNFSDALIGIAKYDNYVDTASIVGLLEEGFKNTNDHGVIETIFGLNKEVQISEDDFKRISPSPCQRIKDVNARDAIVAGMNEWAKNSNLNITLEKTCEE